MPSGIDGLARPSRPSFVTRLHQLLCSEQHPEYLHWLNNDTFAITSVDAHARTALHPQWDFRSLSSFIRQLSYYSFKRLSDRRRSAERRSSLPAYIVFTHPSGNFVRDDQSKAADIPRKLRARKPATKRKNSTASSAGAAEELRDRSPSPGDGPVFDIFPKEESKPSDVQLGLQRYQLQPWNAFEHVRSAHSSPRIIPVGPPSHLYIQPQSEASPSNDASSFPSPDSVPSYSTFSTTSYHPSYTHAPQPRDQDARPLYYYTSPAPHSALGLPASYGVNELPPLRTLTSALVAPPSPPPRPYTTDLCPPGHHPLLLIPDEEEATPSPIAFHAQDSAPSSVVLPPVPHLDLEAQPFAAPTPERMHAVAPAYSNQPARHFSIVCNPATHSHTQEAAKSAFYHLSGEGGVQYPTVPMLHG
ncbi:hypothetical protein JCM10213_004927 [Rhodosporidiobolus nylandii]